MSKFIIPPSGDIDALYVIVGARPGRDEVAARKPFTGPAGDLLWHLLKVPREKCYVTNVRKDFSETHSVPTRAEILAILPELRSELERTKANVIITLGGEALFALSGLESIENWRGSTIESNLLPGRKLLPTWHPAASLYAGAYQLRYVIEKDLRRAINETQYPDIRLPNRSFTLDPTLDEALEFLQSLADPISIDIETLAGVPDCIAISDHPERAICIPFFGGNLTDSELAVVWKALQAVFHSRRIIGQNVQFDVTRLEQLGFILKNIHFDTMLAHYLMWTELGAKVKRKSGKAGHDPEELAGSHKLAFLVSLYTREPYYKHEGRWQGNWTQRWKYNCKDAACTYECYEKLKDEIEKAGQWSYFQDKLMALIRPVMALQTHGLCLDHTHLQKVRERLQLETDYLQLSLNDSVGFDCNVKSEPDLARLIHEQLHITTTRKTKTGKVATDEDTLRGLAYNSPHTDTFKLILDIRERRTLLSNFYNIELEEGRYKANYLIHGTVSGRLSSRAATQGPQMQNIPKDARRMFVPAPGSKFIEADLRRAEAMFTAYDARATRLIALFEDSSRDLYIEQAAASLKKSLKCVEPWERMCFKQVVLAANYGMGPSKFIKVCRLRGINIEDLPTPGISAPSKKAEYFLESYHEANPEIRMNWHSWIRQQVKEKRTLYDAFGRRHLFLGPVRGEHAEETFRAAFSRRPQASVVGVTNHALRVLYNKNIIASAQVHDSILLEWPEDDIENGKQILTQAMTYEFNLHGKSFVIPLDVKIGNNWGSYDPEKNPEGLREC